MFAVESYDIADRTAITSAQPRRATPQMNRSKPTAYQLPEAGAIRIGFGGGCHWCTEAVFQSLAAVTRVEQGFATSLPPNDGWSEAVIVHHKPADIALIDLIAVHLETHASTARHTMRGKYRSAIYTTDQAQQREAQADLDRLAEKTGAHFVTSVLPLEDFRPSEARFHDYFRTDPERPFCRRYIVPKLERLARTRSDLLGDR
ncbi:MAG: peptide-methionine (S)-S-oxide reductase [Pseudomonadota bacterium]